jgi:hypothetical protein
MSKFFPEMESRADALHGQSVWRGEAVEKAKTQQSDPAPNSLAGKILNALQQHGAHADGKTSLAETANVLASSVAQQGSFAAKVSHVEMMVGPHLKKEGEFRANPDLLKAVVGDVLKVTDPPPAKPRGLGM